ncbi:MAG: methionine biosynthesis protein MetW [Candidatus Omnitrophica bacterium]|nr:methionine biosynthesis protein MetW [Candidatus Omnitrophota bacterium]
MGLDNVRLDHRIISGLVPRGSTVLDLGCGNGDLLYILIKEKIVRGQGIEIDEHAIYKCVAKGLNVFHGDIDSGLADYQDKSFDYVILNQSLQQIRHFETVFNDALRVGRRVIIGLPNFAHFSSRFQLFFLGKAPVTRSLPHTWYDSPNVHFLSMTDFIDFCIRQNITIEKRVYLSEDREIHLFANIFSTAGIFVVSR